MLHERFREARNNVLIKRILRGLKSFGGKKTRWGAALYQEQSLVHWPSPFSPDFPIFQIQTLLLQKVGLFLLARDRPLHPCSGLMQL